MKLSPPFLRRTIKRWGTYLRTRFRALRSPQPKTRFLILGEARTGTNLLASYLRSHPDVGVCGEILNPTDPSGIRLRLRTTRAVIRHIEVSLRSLGLTCCGAQTHIYHFILHRLPIDTLCTAMPDLKFLVIYRKSLAEQYVSWKLAKTTGKWVGTSDESIYRDRVVVDPNEFMSYCANLRQRYELLTESVQLRSRAISFCYEQLTAEPQSVCEKLIFPFLGLPKVSVYTKLKKQNTRALSEVVVNYQEVKDLLESARLEDLML